MSLSNITRRHFVCALASACEGSNVSWSAVTPVVKAGIISDTHVKVGDSRSVRALAKAFRYFAKQAVSVVVISGDICHEGTLQELELVMKEWHQAFPGGKNAEGGTCEPFFVFGNHDYHASGLLHKGKAISDEDRKHGILFNKNTAWKMITGEKRFPGEIARRDIGGIVFLGAHWSHEGEISEYLSKHASELPRDRPIVYVQHPHPQNTCFGGKVNSDNGDNRRALLEWPNIFAISGHSHVSMSYDDALWMGGFCSFAAGSTARTRARRGSYNSILTKREVAKGLTRHMPPVDPGKGSHSAILTIYPNRITIARHEHVKNKPLGRVWDIPFPFCHDSRNPFVIAAKASAPEFPAGATVDISEREGKIYTTMASARQIVMSFPPAKSVDDSGRVVDYRIEVCDNAAKQMVVERLVQQEWGTLSEESSLSRRGWCAFGIDELPRKTQLLVRITPLNVGGKGGKPIEKEFCI